MMPSDRGTIYAIGAEGRAFVKIGKTGLPVAKRLQALQLGHPDTLMLLASVSVERDLSRIEKAIHGFLAEERQRGEWFACAVDQVQLEALILRAVASLATEDARTDGRFMKSPVGERVRLVRRKQDVTQEALADKAGLNVITVSRLENLSARAVYADTVAALARALGVSADYLLGLSDREDGHAAQS